MKKFFVILFVLATTMNLMAVTYNAKATITMSSALGVNCWTIIGQSDDFATPFTAEMYMFGRQVAFYAIEGGVNCQTVGKQDLGQLPFGFFTNSETDYTLTISEVEGSQTLVMKDEVLGTVFNLTEGATYVFTAAANTTIEDRFHLYVAPSTPEICHRYGKLQVSGSNGQSVAVKNMDDSATSIGTVAITSDYQEIPLTGLAAGQYKVEWNSQTLIIDVK